MDTVKWMTTTIGGGRSLAGTETADQSKAIDDSWSAKLSAARETAVKA